MEESQSMKFEFPYFINVTSLEVFRLEVKPPGPVYVLMSQIRKLDQQLPLANITLSIDVMGMNDAERVVIYRFVHKMQRYTNGEFTREGDKQMLELFPDIAARIGSILQAFDYEVRAGAAYMFPDSLVPVPGELEFVKIASMGGRGFTVELIEEETP